MIKKIVTGILAVALTAVLFFGMVQWIDKKNLRIDHLQSQVTTLTQERDKALEDLAKAARSLKDANDLVAKLLDADKKAKEQATEAQKEVRDKIKEIEDRYRKLPDNDNNRTRKQTEIALERARGLWASYCIAEPAAKECTTK